MVATIRIMENGPIKVEGEFKLIGSDGQQMGDGTWMKMAFCRCGRSTKLPLCDGSHRHDSKLAHGPGRETRD